MHRIPAVLAVLGLSALTLVACSSGPAAASCERATSDASVLDFAQRYRETLLYNIYVMGRNSIRRGSQDAWTNYPRRVAEVKNEIAKEMKVDAGDPRMSAGGRVQVVPSKYYELLRKPEWRDARAYVLPANQGDFLTSTKFVNTLIKSGVKPGQGASAMVRMEPSINVSMA